MDGSLWIGPNAVLALKREGYRYADVSVADAMAVLRHAGFWKLAWRNLGYGVDEVVRSVWRARQVAAMKRYIPELTLDDLEPGHGPSGVRAQALGREGNLVDDFVIEAIDRLDGRDVSIVHIRNAPSPAATSALGIAEHIADALAGKLGLV